MKRSCSRAALAACFTVALASAQRAPIPQQLTFVPYHASGIYNVGETVGWTVSSGPVEPTYAYKWTIRRNNAEVLKEGKLDLSAGTDHIEISGSEPEMIYVAIEPVAPTTGTPFTGGNTGRNNGLYAVGAAVAPAKIGLAAARPADFDSFWAGKLAAQAKVALNPVLTPVQAETPDIEMSTFVLDALGSHAQGYLARPAKKGKFPALLLLQYAGVYALNARSVAARAAEGWLVMDVDSHDKLPSDPTGSAPRNYAAVGNTDRETSYFLNMYLRDSRALDYLMTRPDWDGKTIVLMGTSMGGQQSLMLAGLRPEKITAVLVCVPSGADSNGDLHGRKAGYPNWPAKDAGVMKTALYFDTVNFASRIEAPVLAAMGFIDTTSPPAGIWTELNQIPVAKEPLPMIESEHNNLTPQKELNWDARSKEVLGILLHGGEFKPHELPLPSVAIASHYNQVEDWAHFPPGVTKWGPATGVDVDGQGNVYVLHRNAAMPVMVFDRHGNFLRAWGQGLFKTTHFLRVDRAGHVWVTDRGDMQAFRFTAEGKLLMTLGKKGVTGDNTSQDTFNGMADLAVAKNGDIFVADGEGPNTRVVKFAANGKFIKWWGGKGTGPGQFDVPHSIAIDGHGLVYVADRANNRIQIFDQKGKFLKQWSHFGTPWGLFIRGSRIYVVDGTDNNCLLIADLKDGKVLEKIAGLSNPTAVAVDSGGAIYVAEVNGARVKKFVHNVSSK